MSKYDKTEPNDPSTWQAYAEEGVRRALALGNRGPMRFGSDDRLEPEILDAYRRTGFYVFTGVLEEEEVQELQTQFDEILERAPIARGSTVDKHGRAALYPSYYTLGKTDDPENKPANVGLISHPLMLMDAALHVYAHPDILRAVASINGEDFVPFHESIFHKRSGEGAPTPWHQDGRTHWAADGVALEQPDGTGKTHGFNLSVCWSHCTPENCLWVVPGSHRQWRLAGGGEFPPISERIIGAVPALMEPGDCVVVNRSSLHGSFPNTSAERRVTMVLGYHNRASAIGARTTNVHAFPRPGKEKEVEYSEEYVLKRTRMIPLAIDARRKRYPGETPFTYTGSYIGGGEWDDEARAQISAEGDEYWQRDITL